MVRQEAIIFSVPLNASSKMPTNAQVKEKHKMVMKNGKNPFTSHCQCANIVHGFCLYSSFSLCLCHLSNSIIWAIRLTFVFLRTWNEESQAFGSPHLSSWALSRRGYCFELNSLLFIIQFADLSQLLGLFVIAPHWCLVLNMSKGAYLLSTFFIAWNSAGHRRRRGGGVSVDSMSIDTCSSCKHGRKSCY